MARYGFPLLIIMMTVVVAGPVAADWVSGLTLEMAQNTVAQIEGN